MPTLETQLLCGLQKEKVYLPPIARSPDVPHGCLIEALLLVLLSLARNKERQKRGEGLSLNKDLIFDAEMSGKYFYKKTQKTENQKTKPTHICQNCIP